MRVLGRRMNFNIAAEREGLASISDRSPQAFPQGRIPGFADRREEGKSPPKKLS
jgi:hypothetical protein